MPAPTREELILTIKANPKAAGMTDAQIAAKADEILPKLVEKYGGDAAPKAAPPAKAPPKPPAAKTPEPPKPSPAVAAQVPRVVEKETVKVTTAPTPLPPESARYTPEPPPPRQVSPMRAKMEGTVPEPALRAVEWAAAHLPAAYGGMTEEQYRTVVANRPPMVLPKGSPAPDYAGGRSAYIPKPATPEPTGATRYAYVPSNMGDVRRADNNAGEVAGMRAALKAIRPDLAEAIDTAPDEQIRSRYSRL